MLDITRVVVVWTVFFLALEGACILDHFGVQMVEGIVRDGVFYHYQSVMIETANGNLEILRCQLFVSHLVLRWPDAGGKAGHCT